MSLDQRLEKLASHAISFRGEIYRLATPKYATTRDLLNGEGSRRFGGRWNPVGMAAVYGSLTPQTALEETLAHSRYYALPLNTSMPRTFAASEAELAVVLDITAGEIRQTLRISEKRLLSCDWRAEVQAGLFPVTQAVGQSAFRAGFKAILVRSAADSSGSNLVVFPENLERSSRLSVISPDRFTS